jgi:hypothetical protein
MAKLGARGRTELARVARETVGDVGQKYTTTYALMSDGKTLRKVKAVWSDGHVSDVAWKVAGWRVFPTDRAAWLTHFASFNYTEVK